MDHDNEADRFRRIWLNSEIERAEGLIWNYRKGIDFFREKIDAYNRALGHVAERLGEPEEGIA